MTPTARVTSNGYGRCVTELRGQVIAFKPPGFHPIEIETVADLIDGFRDEGADDATIRAHVREFCDEEWARFWDRTYAAFVGRPRLEPETLIAIHARVLEVLLNRNDNHDK